MSLSLPHRTVCTKEYALLCENHKPKLSDLEAGPQVSLLLILTAGRGPGGSGSISSTALEKGPADMEKILSTFCLSVAQNLGPELCWCGAPEVSLFPHLFTPRPLLSGERADKDRDTDCSQTLKIRAVLPAPLLAPGQTPRAHAWCSSTRSHCFPRDPIS